MYAVTHQETHTCSVSPFT